MQVGLAVMAGARSLRSRGFVQSAYEALHTLAANRRTPDAAPEQQLCPGR
ncbi:hypothetical protein [Kitasatospora aureofaciens]|nr:hypothetical protein [Kitasatospora aureofaciens]MBV6696950.1 hypothetical protein [Kitasatospora aureofaciens]